MEYKKGPGNKNPAKSFIEDRGPVQWELVTHLLEPPYPLFFYTCIVVTADGGIHLIPMYPGYPWEFGEGDGDEGFLDEEDFGEPND